MADVVIDGLNFSLSNALTAQLTGATALPDTLRIPSTVTSGGVTYTVTGVAQKAFKKKGTVREIIIPASVLRIENDAFSYMADLTGVTIEDASTELYFGFQDGTFLDDEMFYSCDRLARVYIGRNIVWDRSKEGPFQSREALTKVTFGPRVSRIGCGYDTRKELFDDSDNIKQVIFRADEASTSLTVMNSTGLDRATVFTIDRDLTNATPDAEAGEMQEMLSHAVSVTFGSRLKYIPAAMFQGCKALSTVTIPQNVTDIRPRAFRSCTGLKYVVLRGTPTIGTQAFAGCTAIKRVCTHYDEAPTVGASLSADCFDAATYASARLQNMGAWQGDFSVLPWSEFGSSHRQQANVLTLGPANQTEIPSASFDQIEVERTVEPESWSMLSLPMLVDSYYFGADAEVLLVDSLIVESPFRSTLRLKAYDLDAHDFLPVEQPFFLRSRRAEGQVLCGTTDDTFQALTIPVPPQCSVPASDEAASAQFNGTFTLTTDDRGRPVPAFSAYFAAPSSVHRIYTDLEGMDFTVYGHDPLDGDADDDGTLSTADVSLVERQLLGEAASADVFIDVLRTNAEGALSISTITDIVTKINELTTTEEQP